MSDKPNSRYNRLFIFGGILFVLILENTSGLLGEMMEDDFKNQIRNFLWNHGLNPFWVWVAAQIGLLLLLAWVLLRKEVPETIPSVTSNSLEVERNRIIESFERRYKNRYEQKLDDRIPLNLELKYTQIGTKQAFVDRYFAKDAKTEADVQRELVDVVQKHRFVLIIGQPGAGKTTLLIETAQALLAKAKTDGTALPVIFNLSSWRKDYIDFGRWLVDMLIEGNGFSRKLAEETLAKQQILPFLDGLDELGRSLIDEKERNILRGACLVAINKFLNDEKLRPEFVVISSRIEEYKLIQDNAPVKAEILVKPLTIQQIESVLQPKANTIPDNDKRPYTNMTAAQNILHLLKTNPSVHSTLQVPFYFHLATQVFDSQLLDDKIPKRKKEFEAFLVEHFVEKKLNSSKNKMFLDLSKNLHWLSWLSEQVNRVNITQFDVSFLQPKMSDRIEIYKLIVFWLCLLTGILFSLKTYDSETNIQFLISLIGHNWFSQFFGIVVNIIVGFILGGVLAAFLTLCFLPNNINTNEIRRYIRVSKMLGLLLSYLFIGLLFLYALYYFILYLFKFALNYDLATTSFKPLVIASLTGFCLDRFFKEIVVSDSFLIIDTPYKRLASGFVFYFFKYSSMLCMVTILLYTYIFNQYSNSTQATHIWRYSTLMIIFSLGLSVLSMPLTKHFFLRFYLGIENKIPLRLVHFLNYATDDLRFLERDGGSWRFRHQILQDYFADLDKK